MATSTLGKPAAANAPMTKEEKKVIFASSLGTVFEWYDFYLYGSLAAIIAKQFFSGLNETSQFIFALLAFAAAPAFAADPSPGLADPNSHAGNPELGGCGPLTALENENVPGAGGRS